MNTTNHPIENFDYYVYVAALLVESCFEEPLTYPLRLQQSSLIKILQDSGLTHNEATFDVVKVVSYLNKHGFTEYSDSGKVVLLAKGVEFHTWLNWVKPDNTIKVQDLNEEYVITAVKYFAESVERWSLWTYNRKCLYVATGRFAPLQLTDFVMGCTHNCFVVSQYKNSRKIYEVEDLRAIAYSREWEVDNEVVPPHIYCQYNTNTLHKQLDCVVYMWENTDKKTVDGYCPVNPDASKRVWYVMQPDLIRALQGCLLAN